MANAIKLILSKPIQLVDHIIKVVDQAQSFKQECFELKVKTEKLSTLLRLAARASSDLYERPTRRIIYEVEQTLEKVQALVDKCRANGIVKRVFTMIPSGSFKKMNTQLENSIGDVSWLLTVSTPADDRDDVYIGLPPIAATEPILGLIWEQIAILLNGPVENRAEAAGSLLSLVRDSDRNGKLIIEEDGVVPLLKLLKEGRIEGQINAAKTLGHLGKDPENVEIMIHAGICSVFSKILKEGPMKVQANVAWAVSELAANHANCQDHFAQGSIVRHLVVHLAFETIQEHSKYTIPSQKPMSIHSVMIANQTSKRELSSDNLDRQIQSQNEHPMGKKSNQNFLNQQHENVHSLSNNIKRRETEDPETKLFMKSMAARALRFLAKGNPGICKALTESRALLCFAVLLEKGTDEIQRNSAMALMEITAVAEKDADLRRSAFKPNSSAGKAVVEQLLRIIQNEGSNLLVPCIKSLGYLAKIFKATENRIVGSLVRFLDDKEPEIEIEAIKALTKFACTDNYLHREHSKAIIDAGGVKHLVQLAYLGEQIVKIPSLVLLCYVAKHVPESEALAEDEILNILDWASKQTQIVSDPDVGILLQEAKSRLELYQSRGAKGLY